MLQSAAVAFFGVIWMGLVIWTLSKVFRVKAPDRQLNTPKDVDRFARDCAGLRPDACEATASFSASAKDLLETYRATSAALDVKATGILGFVGGGTSVVALVGTNVKTDFIITPLLIAAGVGLTFVLLFAVLAYFPQPVKNPDVATIGTFQAIAIGKTYMNSWMGQQYLEAARQFVPIVVKKSHFVRGALALFALTVVALVTNSLFMPQSEASDNSRAAHFTRAACTYYHNKKGHSE